MRRPLRILMLACVMCMLAPSVMLAHAIHTTLTVVRLDRDGMTLTVRSFADDFSLSVARHAGHAAPRDSSVRADEAARYVQSQLMLSDAAGKAVVLESCGLRREGELYFACFRARVPGGARRTRLRNGMLTELHADQVNIVQVEEAGARRTLLFTRASAPSMLSPQA